MKVRIFNQSHFITKSTSPTSLPMNLDNIKITLPRKKLVFEVQGVEIAKYESEHAIEFVEYEDRIICYLKEGKLKRISFEVFGDQSQLSELKKMVVLRNRVAMYKSPLQREYSNKIQESLMVDKHRHLNIRGFVNLGVIFLCLNYTRLIIESKTEDNFVFIENVNSLVLRVSTKFYRFANRIFFYVTNSIFSSGARFS